MPLNHVGRAQAAEAAERLRKLVPAFADLDYVSSPLVRARNTMEGLRSALGLPLKGYRVDDRLKELSFGVWEGLTWNEVRAHDANGVNARGGDKWNYVPPGGESYAMLADRVAPIVNGLREDTVMVSHGGVARVLLRLLCAVPPREAPVVDIWQGRVLMIAEGRHRWD